MTFSYFPIAHMVWGGGLLSANETSLSSLIFGSTDGTANVVPIDFAGGTVVHINAGMAGLVLALVVGKRIGFGKISMRPHNVPLTMIGAGPAVVRLVRLQRGLRARARRHLGPGVDQHHDRHLRGHARLAGRGEDP